MNEVMRETARSAWISADQKYRYGLRRTWDTDGFNVTFIMLNPSTASAYQDDPTIRRCVRFAKDAGAGELVVANLYGLRATEPAELWRAEDPVGPQNDEILKIYANEADLLVAAWGAYGPDERVNEVVKLLDDVDEGMNIHCLGTTKMGHPRHPLYVRADQPFVKWERP
jgi:hypothetical protein